MTIYWEVKYRNGLQDHQYHLNHLEIFLGTVLYNLIFLFIIIIKYLNYKKIINYSYLMKLHEAVSGILPEVEVQTLYRTVNTSFKEKLREQLVKMNIVNNGGPQHGVVTSELTFYVEALRKLKVLPTNELDDNWMSDIWTR